MCDACGDNPDFKSEPGTPERIAEIHARTDQLIMDHGHQITGVMSDPMFFYTVGRSVMDHPELLITGNLPEAAAAGILNTLASMENDGLIDILALANGEPAKIDGFDAMLKFQRIDPIEAEMFGATRIAGNDWPSVQVIWPDEDGRWPDNPEFSYGPEAQPVHSL